MPQGHYHRFLLMLTASFVVMHVVMYFNTYKLDHVCFSLNRFYMTCLMIVPMSFLMLLFMPAMYPSRRTNSLIVGVGLFGTVLYLLRTQAFVNDTRFMESMIHHHSIAIMVSERADIQYPEVRKLAEGIIATQKLEITEMKAMLQKPENYLAMLHFACAYITWYNCLFR